MQQLKPSEISELIRTRIQSLALSSDVRTQGTRGQDCLFLFGRQRYYAGRRA